ncbi:hypothetical protein [Zavarzinella formosa]|uniref:hypothetical protein n=1 Tax=Zavarzinella formosa TaxID=360055 RepID=UPI00030E95AA|nr:hypothetical protein [Zavarzinella formosa]
MASPLVFPDVALAYGLGAIPPLLMMIGWLRGKPPRTADIGLTIIVGVLLSLGAGSVYVKARSRHEAAKLDELLEQSRIAEARVLARQLQELNPDQRIRNQPVERLADDLDRLIARLESHVMTPLLSTASPVARLERARELAILDRREEALETLESLEGTPFWPEGLLLRGVIRENENQLTEALTAYESARSAWREHPEFPGRPGGLIRAQTGIHYSLRQLGRVAEAETELEQLLSMSPTAEHHFLAARFFEDIQRVEESQTHAREAMRLDPKRYNQQGRELINKLATSHFGCFRVDDDRPAARPGWK